MPWAGKWSLVPTFFLLPDDGSFGLFHVVSGWTGGSAAGQVVATAGGSRVASKIACQGSFHGLPCSLTWGLLSALSELSRLPERPLLGDPSRHPVGCLLRHSACPHARIRGR